MASPNGVPLMMADSFSWFPPVMKMPVAPVQSRSTSAGSAASSRLSGRTPNTSAGAQPGEQGDVHVDDLRARGSRPSG